MKEILWKDLSRERREELLNRCGYSETQWKREWSEMLPFAQLLLARELESMSGNTATLRANNVELIAGQDGIGWENHHDPRICKKDDPGVRAALLRAALIAKGQIQLGDSVAVDYVTGKAVLFRDEKSFTINTDLIIIEGTSQ